MGMEKSREVRGRRSGEDAAASRRGLLPTAHCSQPTAHRSRESTMNTTHNNPQAEFRKPNSRFFPIHAWAIAAMSRAKSLVAPTTMNASSCLWPTSDEAWRRKWAATYVAKNVISRQKSGRQKSRDRSRSAAITPHRQPRASATGSPSATCGIAGKKLLKRQDRPRSHAAVSADSRFQQNRRSAASGRDQAASIRDLASKIEHPVSRSEHHASNTRNSRLKTRASRLPPTAPDQ
jgi:hypothetical protein